MYDAQTGTLPLITIGNFDPHPIKRLTIGVVSVDGHTAEIVFERDDAKQRLVAQIPEVAAPLPTEEELNADYLLRKDWTRSYLHGIGEIFSDPIGGGDYALANALDIQAGREHREFICAELSFEDTPLGLEVYGGE